MNRILAHTGNKTLRKINPIFFSRFKQEPNVKYEDILDLEEHETQLHDPSYLLEARRNDEGRYILPKQYSDDEYLKMMGEFIRNKYTKQGA